MVSPENIGILCRRVNSGLYVVYGIGPAFLLLNNQVYIVVLYRTTLCYNVGMSQVNSGSFRPKCLEKTESFEKEMPWFAVCYGHGK